LSLVVVKLLTRLELSPFLLALQKLTLWVMAVRAILGMQGILVVEGVAVLAVKDITVPVTLQTKRREGLAVLLAVQEIRDQQEMQGLLLRDFVKLSLGGLLVVMVELVGMLELRVMRVAQEILVNAVLAVVAVPLAGGRGGHHFRKAILFFMADLAVAAVEELACVMQGLLAAARAEVQKAIQGAVTAGQVSIV